MKFTKNFNIKMSKLYLFRENKKLKNNVYLLFLNLILKILF